MERKVLVVDDNPKNLQVVAALLSDNGYKVEVALDGKGAIKWLDKDKFDAILLDVMMPELSGFETCKLIKQNRLFKDIPILFLTARNDVDSVTEGFKVGGVDYIYKPFNHNELLVRINTHVELKLAKEKLMNMNIWLQTEVENKTAELTIANYELKQANEELKKLDTAKNDFLKSISHEIRTPLNGIVGSMNLLKTISKDEYTNEILSLLNSSVDNLEKYSYSALQISNLHLKGESQLDLQHIDLMALFKSQIHQHNTSLNKKNIGLSFSTKLNEVIINGDLEYLQSAISSLIESSITYTNEGVIEIFIQKSENYVEINIKDSGSLFSSNQVSHFFDSISSQNYQFERNNAIELYLAKMIIQLHKGDLVFNNLEDKSGTITTIKLPIIHSEVLNCSSN